MNTKPMEVLPVQDVVDIIFGKRPERTEYPTDIDFNTLDVGDEPTLEDLSEMNERLREYEKVVTALEVLGEQYGCPKETGGSDVA